MDGQGSTKFPAWRDYLGVSTLRPAPSPGSRGGAGGGVAAELGGYPVSCI